MVATIIFLIWHGLFYVISQLQFYKYIYYHDACLNQWTNFEAQPSELIMFSP